MDTPKVEKKQKVIRVISDKFQADDILREEVK